MPFWMLSSLSNGLCILESKLTELELKAHHLDAPIPCWVKYDDQQAEIFRSPEISESLFDEDYGPDIPVDYLQLFEDQMRNCDRWICGNEKLNLKGFSCCIVKLILKKASDFLGLSEILVRPCAESLGFLRIVLYRLITLCVQNRKHLHVSGPLPKTLSVMRRISPKFEEITLNTPDYVDKVWRLSYDDILQIDKKVFGLTDYFISEDIGNLVLNRAKFPTSLEMNSQVAVDGRKSIPHATASAAGSGGAG